MNEELAEVLMTEFAELSGVSGGARRRRYLWTDAFAVCNFLGLHRRTGKDRYLKWARELVHQVNHILGRHLPDDQRRGWINGLSEEEGEQHPTSGGLRIGKKLNERGPNEPPDARLEWDQDGQYFHYLTKWMHALDCMDRETGERHYHVWAVELAATAHRAFTYEVCPGGPKRMAWKMSIDLSRPLVASMGQHDPLDGLMACLELQTGNSISPAESIDLRTAIADFEEMCQRAHWVTDDPLGIGGLLDVAARLAPIVEGSVAHRRQFLRRLLIDAETSIRSYVDRAPLGDSPEHRLAFRELGLSIGIHGLERFGNDLRLDQETTKQIDRLLQFRPLADEIDGFWSQTAPRKSRMWNEHRDINGVMLATSHCPDGYFAHSRARER